MAKPLPPFTCSFSSNVPELLLQLKCTLALSTYQAGKVILLSATSDEDLIQLPRNFAKPMGIAIADNKMAVASQDEVTVLANAPGLAPAYPRQPNTYDAFYVPRSTYYTGQVDIHDLEWGGDQLWAVNTLFSCICNIDEDYSFRPIWQPSFIDELNPEDRCHLNGMALVDGKPKFATALGQSNSPQGWRENKANGGVLIDVQTNDLVLQGLPMPHSPRLYNDELYLLLSATGEFVRVDREKGTYEVIHKLDGFVRGMARYDDYLFVGLSKLRKRSTTFQDLPVSEKSVFCGIVIVYLPKVSLYGHIKYENSVEEIYDVKVLPNMIRPGLIGPAKPEHKWSLALPGTTFWAQPDRNGDQ